MKKVLFLFFTVLCFFSCSKRNVSSNVITEEPKVESTAQVSQEFVNIPSRVRRLKYTTEDGVVSQLTFNGPKTDDATSAIYEFKKDRATVMTGNLKMTKDEFYLEYPDTINETADSDYISKWLGLIFPNKETAILKWDQDRFDLEEQKSGAYVINGISFIDENRSKALDKFTLNDYAVTCSQLNITVSEETYFFEKPDSSSNKIFITKNPLADLDYSKDRMYFNQKLKIISQPFSIPAVEGIRLKTRARYVPKDKTDETWYYVRIDSLTDSKYGWINGKSTSVSDTAQESKSRFASLIDKLEKAGTVQIVQADTSNLPSEINCFDIEPDAESYFFYDDNNIWFVTGYTGLYTVLPRSCLAVDSDGYLKCKYNQYSMLFITGGIEQVFRDFKNDGENTYDDPDRTDGFHNRNIKSITASSSFEETIKGKLIKYTPDNLGKAFEQGCKCHPYWWNYNHIPWVEGVDGNGIGEYITVEFTEPVIELELINGYSDINNMKLYKENARVKTFKLEDLENNTTGTVSFEDYVYFNTVILEKPTTKIRLTIKEVYPGTKYQDTCFSAILATSYKRYKSDNKKNAETLKKLFERTMEVSPEEFFKIQTKLGL